MFMPYYINVLLLLEGEGTSDLFIVSVLKSKQDRLQPVSSVCLWRPVGALVAELPLSLH